MADTSGKGLDLSLDSLPAPLDDSRTAVADLGPSCRDIDDGGDQGSGNESVLHKLR